MRYIRILFILVVLLLPGVVRAETRLLAPHYSSKVTWTKAGSPYIIDGDMLVDFNSVLTIEPGVVVRAATTTAKPYKPFMTFRGTVKMLGTAEEPITVENFSPIIFNGRNQEMRHVNFNNSQLRVSLSSSNVFSTTTIVSSSFRNSPQALEISSGGVAIEDSEFIGNDMGIYSKPSTLWNKLNIKNSIFDNEMHIRNENSRAVDASMNWWGKDGPGNKVQGLVETSPWLLTDPRVKEVPCCSNVLFLPGLQASRLYRVDKDLLGGGTTTRRAWEPYTNNDVRSLYLNHEGESMNQVFPDGIIESAYGVKGIYKNMVAMLDGVVAEKKINEWLPFSYDWRMDVLDVVNNKLIDEVERLATSSRTGKVTVIAHSNGGLVAKMLGLELEKFGKAHLIDKVVLIAVPQLGTPQAVAGMLHGDSQEILGGVVLKKSVARTWGLNMSGAYGLLPSEEFFKKLLDPVVTFSGKAVGGYEDFKHFLTGGDGRGQPSENDLATPVVLSNTLLTKSVSLHDRIDSWKFPTTTQVLALAGWGIPTTKTIEYSTTTPRIKKGISGDGTVLSESAFGNIGKTLYFNQGLYNFDQHLATNHVDILQPSIVNSFLSDILATTSLTAHNMYSSYLSLEKPDKLPWMDWIQVSVHSPVDIDVYDSKGGHMGLVPLPGTTDSDLQWFENTIGGQYDTVGEEKYITLPANENYTVKLKGTGTGTFTYQVQKLSGESMTEVENIVYADLPVTPLLEAKVMISGMQLSNPLEMDVDGNGTTDIHASSSPEINPMIHLDSIKIIIGSLNLDSKEEKQLLKRIEKIRTMISEGRSDRVVKKLKTATEKLEQGHWNLRNITPENKTLISKLIEDLLATLETAN